MSLSDKSITSDKEYLQIAFEGSILMAATGAADADSSAPSDPDPFFTGFAGSTTITHNLGYVPLVRIFWDANKNGRWYSSRSRPTGLDPWVKILVTTTTAKIILITDSGVVKTNVPVFYRIYKLGSKSLTSDERIDKIFKKELVSGSVAASVSSAAESRTTLTISHGQTAEVPIYTIQHSTDQTNWYDQNAQIVGAVDTTSGPPGNPSRWYYTTAEASIDATNIYIVLRSNYATSKTIYVRYTLDTRS